MEMAFFSLFLYFSCLSSFTFLLSLPLHFLPLSLLLWIFLEKLDKKNEKKAQMPQFRINHKILFCARAHLYLFFLYRHKKRIDNSFMVVLVSVFSL